MTRVWCHIRRVDFDLTSWLMTSWQAPCVPSPTLRAADALRSGRLNATTGAINRDCGALQLTKTVIPNSGCASYPIQRARYPIRRWACSVELQLE